MAIEDRFKELAPEQRAKFKNAKTPEEVLELAREEGYELSDDELEGVSGGWEPCDDMT